MAARSTHKGRDIVYVKGAWRYEKSNQPIRKNK